MELFVLLVLILIILSIIKFKGNDVLSIIPLILMIILCGCRSVNVGTDTLSYVDGYRVHEIWSLDAEPLFSMLMSICKLLGFSDSSFLFTTSLLTYIPLYIGIRKWSVNTNYSLLIYVAFSVYFFCNSFNVIRNAIAASFLLLSLCYFADKKFYRTIIFLIVSICFHYSVVFALPFLFIAKLLQKQSPLTVGVLLLFSILVGLFSNYNNYADIINMQLNMLNIGDVAQHYNDVYLSNLTNNEFNANGIIMQILPMTTCSFLSMFSKNVNPFIRSVILVGTLLGNVFVSILFVYRLTLYFTIFAVFVIPQISKKSGTKPVARFIMNSMVSILVLYFLFCLVTESEALVVLPYSFN